MSTLATLVSAANHPPLSLVTRRIPHGAIIAALARTSDLYLYHYPNGGAWFIRCCGITAPIPHAQTDCWHSLVCEVSCGHMRPASLARSVALLPGAISDHEGAAT